MPKTTVSIVQSNYIPWKGYFDLIGLADVFVFYDDVQFTKEDWRNRNKLKTPNGPQWLTVPCGKDTNRLVCEVELASSDWQERHWSTIQLHYRKAAAFAELRPYFEELYRGQRWTNLSQMNQHFVQRIARDLLGIRTEFTDSRRFRLPDDRRKEDRWVELVKQVGAQRFLIGPSARNYLDGERQARIAEQGVELAWMDYAGYPAYRQLHPPFEHAVSVVDLLFNEGREARRFLKCGGARDGLPGPR
jgi:hypothetical protein